MTLLPIADKKTPWSKQKAIQRVRQLTDSTKSPSAEYADAFFYVADNGELFGNYKLPFADVIDGALTAIPDAIHAAAAVIDGAMGGVKIPEADLQEVKDKIQAYYAHMGETVPWDPAKAPRAAEEAQVTPDVEVAAVRSAETVEAVAVETVPTSEVLYRDAEIEAIERGADPDTRTISLSFSSETPVARSYGMEVLSHEPNAVDLERLNSAGPLLLDHDTRKQIGVVKKAWIGADKKGRAQVQFSKSALGTEVWNDVQDGVRKNVSVGYMTTGKPQVSGNTYRWSWTPSHIAIVSEPADITVGINRGLESPVTSTEEINKRADTNLPEGGFITMSEEQKQATTNTNDVVIAERKRASEIREVATKFNEVTELQDLARQAIDNGTSVQDFQKEAFKLLETKKAVVRAPEAGIGLSDNEARNFSVSKMINYMLDPTNKRAAYEAGFEIEASNAARDKFGSTRGGNSFSLPYEVMTAKQKRAVTSSTAASLIETEVLLDSFIDVLRNSCQVSQLGATHLDGLVNTVSIPRMSAASTAYWLATDSSSLTAAAPSFDNITLSPKTLTGYTQVTRQALTQIPGIDAILTQDLARTSGVALDLACINGSGSSGQPKGILNLSSLPTVALGTNGAAPTYAAVVQMIGKLSQGNALFGKLAFLTNGNAMETLATTLKDTGNTASNYILGGVNGDMNHIAGYDFALSNNVPNNLTKGTGTNLSAMIFGNWQDAVIASWGTTEIVVDNLTGAGSNQVYIYSFGQYDFNVRHLASFAAIVDMITT